MQKILIVREGEWGSMENKDYQDFILMCQEAIQDVEITGSYGKKEKAAAAMTIPDAKIAEDMIKTGQIDAVVFISRGMEQAAERLAREYPKTRVVVFTGLIPDGKVIWVSKHWIQSNEDIQNHILV